MPGAKGSKGTRLGAAGKKAVNRGNATTGQRASAEAQNRKSRGQGRRKKSGRQTRQTPNQNSQSTADEGKWNNKSPDQIGLIDSVSSVGMSSDLLDVGYLTEPSVVLDGTNSKTVESFRGQINEVVDKLKRIDRLLKKATTDNLKKAEKYIKSLMTEINNIDAKMDNNFDLGKWENNFRSKLNELNMLLGKRVIEFEEIKKEILANQQRRAKEREMKIAKNKVNKQERAKEREKKEAKNKVNKQKRANARTSALSNARKTGNSKIKEIEKLKNEILKTTNSTKMYNKVEKLEELLEDKTLRDLYLPEWYEQTLLSIPSNTKKNKISNGKMNDIKSAIKGMPNLKTLATNNNASAKSSTNGETKSANKKPTTKKKTTAKKTTARNADNEETKSNNQNAGSKKKKATKKKATKKKATKKKKSTTTKKKKAPKKKATKKKVQKGGFFESLFSIFF
jgi:hypothetical protein